MSFMRSHLAGGALAAAVVACVATSAGAASSTVRFKLLPQHLFQGGPAAVSVVVTPQSRQCGLAVRYADGARQPGLVAHSTAGLREWSWTVGEAAAAGPARATVSCGRSGVLTRTITVVGGTLRHSKLTIADQGYSQRPASYGSGSSVSYGVVLHNPSPAEDAQDVTVLVNFLDGSDHVLESATTRVPAIGAASSFNLGGSATLETQASVARLEIVVQTGAYRPAALHEPAVANVAIVPGSFDPNWVASVTGELVNDHPTDLLTYAQLSIVIFDAAGHVVGGSTGSMSSSLPPGTRAFFRASGGLSSIPMANASVAAISIEPSYKPPGA
jgi:hypothetical protein